MSVSDPHRAVEVGARVVTRYAHGAYVHNEGRVLGYCDAPQFFIEADDGTRFWWRADLTDPTPGTPDTTRTSDEETRP